MESSQSNSVLPAMVRKSQLLSDSEHSVATTAHIAVIIVAAFLRLMWRSSWRYAVPTS